MIFFLLRTLASVAWWLTNPYNAALAACVFAVGGYAAPQALATFGPPPDLKKRYGAQWAVVTGSSSGIGFAIAAKLAAQGLNVVLAALDDDHLAAAHDKLRKQYPGVTFMKVGVDLSRPGYVEALADATKGIDVQLVFNNAGYIVTGFFHKTDLNKLMCNMECNAASCVQITHLFVTRMVDKGLPGCVVFTSSAAAYLPAAFNSLYASTKAFISSFASGLAAELKSKNIDVLSFHPSPVESRFYDNAHKLDMMDFFKRFAVQPDELPNEVFKAIGRTVWRDIGGVALAFRLLGKLVDFNLMCTIFMHVAHMAPDYKRYA